MSPEFVEKVERACCCVGVASRLNSTWICQDGLTASTVTREFTGKWRRSICSQQEEYGCGISCWLWLGQGGFLGACVGAP